MLFPISIDSSEEDGVEVEEEDAARVVEGIEDDALIKEEDQEGRGRGMRVMVATLAREEMQETCWKSL